MGLVVQIDGTLTTGPSAAGDPTFPGSSGEVALTLAPAQKPAVASTGFMRRVVASPGVYVVLDGPGSGTSDTLAQGNFLYLRTSAAMLVRMTYENGVTDIEAIVPVKGLAIIEIDESKYLRLLEVQGSGTVEWLVSGNL